MDSQARSARIRLSRARIRAYAHTRIRVRADAAVLAVHAAGRAFALHARPALPCVTPPQLSRWPGPRSAGGPGCGPGCASPVAVAATACHASRLRDTAMLRASAIRRFGTLKVSDRHRKRRRMRARDGTVRGPGRGRGRTVLGPMRLSTPLIFVIILTSP